MDRTQPTANSAIPYADFLWIFAQQQTLMVQASQEIRQYVEELLAVKGLRYHAVTARAKTLASYAKKARRLHPDGSPIYPEPARRIGDCVGARVIVYTVPGCREVTHLFENTFALTPDDVEKARKTNGYSSAHLEIRSIPDPDAARRYPAVVQYLKQFPGLEIQVRTVAEHAWAEFEHDVMYKPGLDHEGAARERLDALFAQAGELREQLDNLFERIDLVAARAIAARVSDDDAGTSDDADTDADETIRPAAPRTPLAIYTVDLGGAEGRLDHLTAAGAVRALIVTVASRRSRKDARVDGWIALDRDQVPGADPELVSTPRGPVYLTRNNRTRDRLETVMSRLLAAIPPGQVTVTREDTPILPATN
ncbi:MAG: RelA/SpoT domain-containing protein [Cellulomonadaceae bacterium]|nr:RelA/SpoT domain-containing protein [Cellulomonadaceae bacterium]